MPESAVNNKRVAKNTIMLYFRMLFLMLISFFTSRVILQTLGVEDYGIYNVVGGFVSMLTFLNSALSGSTSRYITFALGKDDLHNLRKVFSSCQLTHIIIAGIVLLFAETVGIWFVTNKLTIPESRMDAAMWVYQCSILSAVVMICSVPYNSCIIAHEKMSAFAYISMFEALAKLAIVYILKIGLMDNLILYAILMLTVQIILRLIYTIYCHKHFEESKFVFIWDKPLIKELFSFAGWNLCGDLAWTLYTQGINVVLNMFFGPAVNAARGIATQVQSAVMLFAVNFQTAINPQITKSYANNDLENMFTLVFRSTRFTFFLLFCLALPIFVEADFILHLWLGKTPEYAVTFLRLMLVICVMDSMSNPLGTAVQATGNVKLLQTVVSGILLLIVPSAYVALKFGCLPESVFYVHIFIDIFAIIARMLIVRSLIEFSIQEYLIKTIIPCFAVFLFSSIAVLMIKTQLTSSIINSLIIIGVSIVISSLFFFIFGLTKGEKEFFLSKIKIK